MEITQIMKMLDGETAGSIGNQYAFKDNDSSILAVAHLDTVQKESHTGIVRLKNETLVFNPKLDDRLGVYTILHVLPKLGIKADILFTENEEKGKTTASYFRTEKEYNWIVEFDRRGSDAVTYDYHWKDVVEKYFETGLGSFSDISELEHLGCKAVNIGIGYYDEHSRRAYFVVEEYLSQIEKFVRFYDEHKGTRFEHKQIFDRYYESRYRMFLEYYITCKYCGSSFYDDETYCTASSIICPDCGEHIPLTDVPDFIRDMEFEDIDGNAQKQEVLEI